MNQNEIIRSAMRDLRVGTLLTFIAINLRFVSGNILNALIFLNIIQSKNPDRRFDIHAPSTPDIWCDVVMIIVLTVAYVFITSNQIKNVRTMVFLNIHEMSNQNLSTIRRLKDYIYQYMGIFYATVTGASMYLFSRYDTRTFSTILQEVSKCLWGSCCIESSSVINKCNYEIFGYTSTSS